jgi:hypothetical protein
MVVGSFFYGVGVGKDKATTTWQARETANQVKYSAAVKAAGDRVIAAERETAKTLADVSARYQARLKEKDFEKERAISTATAVAGGLWVGTIRQPDPATAGSPTSTSACRCDGGTRSRLSGKASEFFIGEASRADKIVEQLKACQAVVAADRKQPGD